MPYPDFETYSRLAEGVQLVPVYRRLVCDSLTAVSAFHKLDTGESACLFESVVGGEKVGRYSFLSAEPFLRLEAFGNEVRVTAAGHTQTFASDDPLEELRRGADSPHDERLDHDRGVGLAPGHRALERPRLRLHLHRGAA